MVNVEEIVQCPVLVHMEEATPYMGAVLCSKESCPYGYSLGEEIDPEGGHGISGESKLRLCSAAGKVEKSKLYVVR